MSWSAIPVSAKLHHLSILASSEHAVSARLHFATTLTCNLMI